MSERLAAQRRWVSALDAQGALVAYARLAPVEQGHRVTRRDGALVQRSLADDPDARAIAALLWVRAASIEAATALAQQCPLGEGESLAARAVMQGVSFAELARSRGPVFTAIVRGAAASLDASRRSLRCSTKATAPPAARRSTMSACRTRCASRGSCAPRLRPTLARSASVRSRASPRRARRAASGPRESRSRSTSRTAIAGIDRCFARR